MITKTDIEAARDRITRYIHRTPLIFSRSFSEMSKAEVYVKAENLQKTGSFKARGAFNKLSLLERGKVIAASRGNHAQAVAFAAATLGLHAKIVMPVSVPLVKEEATKGYGAEVELYGDTLQEAIEYARAQAGYTFVHPYDDDEIIAGQGTLGAELIESMDRIDYVIVPVGGGGLISGIALMVKETLSSAKVIGVQTESATSAFASFKEGKVSSRTPLPTIADGIAVGRVGERPFEIITRYVDDIALVTEEPIAMSVVLFLERMKFVVEGAGAVGLAALLEHRERFLGKRVVIVVSGGNIDLTLIDRIIQKGLLTSGRMTVLEVVVDDVPGSLHALSGIIASHRGNIVNVTHDRLEPDVSIGRTRIIFTMETRGTAHFAEMLSEMKAKGFKPTVKHSTEDKG